MATLHKLIGFSTGSLMQIDARHCGLPSNQPMRVGCDRSGSRRDLPFPFQSRDRSDNEAALKLILLDFKLPNVDGLEVLKRIKSYPRTKIFENFAAAVAGCSLFNQFSKEQRCR